MSTTSWILIAIAALVVVIALAVIVVAWRRRHREHQAARASEIRASALDSQHHLTQEKRRAEEAEAQARLARTEAERREQEAAEARRAVQQDEARTEDRLREADRIDPHVDPSADDYRPGATATEHPGDTTGTGDRTATGDGSGHTTEHTTGSDGSTRNGVPGSHRKG